MEEEPEEVKKKEKKVEPSFEILSSPARIMVAQLKVLATVDGSRYIPVKQVGTNKQNQKDWPFRGSWFKMYFPCLF